MRREPWKPELEDELRRVLLAVADCVVPAPDGLDKIRSRIRAGRPVQPGWIAVAPAARGTLAARGLQQAGSSARAFSRAAWQRFAPGADTVSWHRWLRPAAAVATAFLVVLAGSWAVAALPRIIAPSGNSPNATGVGKVPLTQSSRPGVWRASSSSPGFPGRGSWPAIAPPRTARPSTARQSVSAAPSSSSLPPVSPAPSSSSLPSLSPAPSASSSPSPSPSPSASCTPSPAPSPPGHGKHSGPPDCRKQHRR